MKRLKFNGLGDLCNKIVDSCRYQRSLKFLPESEMIASILTPEDRAPEPPLVFLADGRYNLRNQRTEWKDGWLVPAPSRIVTAQRELGLGDSMLRHEICGGTCQLLAEPDINARLQQLAMYRQGSEQGRAAA